MKTSTAVATVLIALTVSASASADQVAQERTWDSRRALVSVGAVNLRAEPSLDSAVLAVLLRAWPVAILNDDGPLLTIAGETDHWTYVATFRCTDEACRHFEAGWVANSYLAFDDRFERLDDSPSGVLAGHDSRSVFAYDVSTNGAFTRWRLPCTAGACNIVPAVTPMCDYDGELRLSAFCVLTGTLHRYRNLVRGKSADGGWLDRQDVNLFVNAAGSLCVHGPAPTGGAGLCTGAESDTQGDRDPATAIARLAADRRQRLALTAASSLNLRDAPSLSADVVARLPRASVVERIGEHQMPVILNGRRDQWVPVSVIVCAGGTGCEPAATGWVMESHLAYERRLTLVTDWPRAERFGNQAFGFEVASDGTFRRWEACGTDQSGLKICSRSGQLYQYRDLFVFRDDGGEVHTAYMAAAGNLCLISSGIRSDPARRCDG